MENKPNTPPSPPAKLAVTAPQVDEATLRSLVKSIAEEMLTVSVATAQAMQPRPAPAPSNGRQDFGPRCATCGQYESACEREHQDISVYPTNYPEFGDFFQGVFVNGVRYLSNNGDHFIPVPKKAVTMFQGIIRTYEQNERESRVGRSKQHNSGHITNPQPAQAGWR